MFFADMQIYSTDGIRLDRHPDRIGCGIKQANGYGGVFFGNATLPLLRELVAQLERNMAEQEEREEAA
jgi:hypothetical protein